MKDVLIVGGGIAGLECARQLAQRGHSITLMDSAPQVGGNVANWHNCYPFDKTGQEIINELRQRGNIQLIPRTRVNNIEHYGNTFRVSFFGGEQNYDARCVVLTTGFTPFDASIKEELGYGVYPRVITSIELEKAWGEGRLPFDTSDTEAPRFAIVHCVGSRDLKCGVTHCSKVCCMAGIKAAKELKKHYPTCQVTNYYMDLRMFDLQYEELYHSAQIECNTQFVRGRISEISLGNLGRLKLKSEDTLLGTPIVDRVHGVVLMVGMQPGTVITINNQPLTVNSNGFLAPKSNLNPNTTEIEGLFVAGACKGPKTITETLADAKAASLEIDSYLNTIKNELNEQ